MTRHLVAAAALVSWATAAAAQPPGAPRLRVFLDCESCFDDYIREEVGLVEYVRDPSEADVHVIVTDSPTASGGRERAVSLIGIGALKGMDHGLKAVSETGDSENTQRERLATAITIGLLNYLARDGVVGTLAVTAEQRSGLTPAPALYDPWKNWVLSVSGSLSMEGEESSRSMNVSGSVGADRITDRWKVTTGLQIDYEREDFDLDEDQGFRVTRRERELDSLAVRSIDDHWSAGITGSIDSSSFDNIDVSVAVAPALEYNLFPYSAYTRRQLRMNYSVGPYRASYVEETLFGKRSETLAQQEASVSIEQREPWGSLEARFEASNFLPGFDRHRLELEGDVTVRLARGLSLSVEGSASRLRDQLSLPRRGATSEEVLLRLRRLRSGYEYDLQLSLTYTFGSIFNSIVNPRFGQ